MKDVNVYFNFNGNAEEAMNFYAKALGGTVESMMRFGDAPMPSPDNWKNKIMHCTVRVGNVVFMASDKMPDQHDISFGNSITINLNAENEAEQDRVFNALAQGGNVTMPLEVQFWGARYGQLTDKYGINWMSNLNVNPQG